MQLEDLKKVWALEDISASRPVRSEELLSFQNMHGVTVPVDLAEYFKILNGTNEEYDSQFFKFYSLSQFKSIDEELKNWAGLPDYSGIVNTLADYNKYFVFADYSFHMFSYAIYLSNKKTEVLVIGGDKYKKIANSFSEFIELYLSNSIELYLNSHL